MAIHQTVAFGIVESIGSLWGRQELLDHTVRVKDVDIKCHRFILSACSKFFSALFGSEMKESLNDITLLGDISPETFTCIIKAIYTGTDVLTPENVTDIWFASNQLQIDFLKYHCEMKIIEFLSLENFEDFHQKATLLDSDRVLKGIFDFMLTNFEKVRHKKIFLEQSPEDFLAFVESYHLVVSTEDYVLESILQWVQSSVTGGQDDDVTTSTNRTVTEQANHHFGNVHVTQNSESSSPVPFKPIASEQNSENKRIGKLIALLRSSRASFASINYLHLLCDHPLLAGNSIAASVLYKASMYNCPSFRHGQWPASATHRINSDFDHFAVYIGNHVKALSLSRDEIFELPKPKNCDQFSKLHVFDNELYACENKQRHTTNLYRFSQNGWNLVTSYEYLNATVIAHDTFFYNFNTYRGWVERICPKDENKGRERVVQFPDGIRAFSCLVALKRELLAFYGDYSDSKYIFAVQSLNTLTKVWTKLDNLQLEGSANGIISFRDDHVTYMLAGNGQLWAILESADGDTLFKYQGKLWQNNRQLYGAVIYSRELILFGTDPDVDKADLTKLLQVSTSLNKISHWTKQNEYITANVVPVVLPNSFFLKT